MAQRSGFRGIYLDFVEIDCPRGWRWREGRQQDEQHYNPP